ncbi:MAG TPA: hypothetical protein VF502_19680 [Stellaceae bacterium]
MQQLFTSDLRPGDLLLQANSGSVGSRIIEWAQRHAHQLNSQVVHAAIMFDNAFVIEAVLHGIQASDLRVQRAGYGYLVYRPRRADLAKQAARCAKAMFEMNQSRKNLPYAGPYQLAGSLSASAGTAPKADDMVRLFNRIREGEKQSLFCSQFIVFVYQFAGQLIGYSPTAIFAASAAKVSPSTLGSLLQSNPNFEEAGYVMPGERMKQPEKKGVRGAAI